jgi:membrane-associated phospholipid phosphatase
LKTLIHRHRPHLWSHAAIINSYSFPSGHATVSTAFFAGTTYAVWKLVGRRAGVCAMILSAILVSGIGFSRIYLGVHWPSDVVAGYALGLGWVLLLIVVAEPRLSGRRYGRRRTTRPATPEG